MNRSRIGLVVSVAALVLVTVAVVRRWAGHWVVFVVLVGAAAGYVLSHREQRGR